MLRSRAGLQWTEPYGPDDGVVGVASLIVVAQGSPRPEANEEAIRLAARLEAVRVADVAACAFLEHARPLLQDAIDVHARLGAKEITILPLFVSAGPQVAREIPAIVRAARVRNPDVIIRILEHVGASELFVRSIERMVQSRLNTAGELDTRP